MPPAASLGLSVKDLTRTIIGMETSIVSELKIEASEIGHFRNGLLDWYAANGRKFPWRDTRDPYLILVAEILLQRTRAQKVEEIFPLFAEAFPNVQSLASASLNRIADIIRPLGIAYRAARLQHIAKAIMEDFGGRIPNHRAELMRLPGIGDYTANAVLCFAYGQRLAVLDPTVVRVFERVFDVRSEKAKPTTDKRLWLFAEELLPVERFRDYNFALLDFGALVCTASKPKHDECPIRDICRYYAALREPDHFLS